MNLLDLAEEMGFKLCKTSGNCGGEYHCPCPSCGGNDRFMFWPEKDRYWCRQCNAKGDAIQFCRDFQRLSFHAACIKVQKEHTNAEFQYRAHLAGPAPIRPPSHSWENKAQIFTENSLQRLLIDKTSIELLFQRGLSFDTIKKNQLGWNPVKTFYQRADWGFEETEKHKWICLPAGIVIPIFEGNDIRKLKIRKFEWKEADFYGKYYEVPGSSNMVPIFGNRSCEIAVIVEAEFDAMLVIQEVGDLCACVALGGAQKKPDSSLSQWLRQRKSIIFALDFDEAGKKEYLYWQKSYPNLKPWPVPEEKSPGDYYRMGGNIRDWIVAGIS